MRIDLKWEPAAIKLNMSWWKYPDIHRLSACTLRFDHLDIEFFEQLESVGFTVKVRNKCHEVMRLRRPSRGGYHFVRLHVGKAIKGLIKEWKQRGVRTLAAWFLAKWECACNYILLKQELSLINTSIRRVFCAIRRQIGALFGVLFKQPTKLCVFADDALYMPWNFSSARPGFIWCSSAGHVFPLLFMRIAWTNKTLYMYTCMLEMPVKTTRDRRAVLRLPCKLHVYTVCKCHIRLYSLPSFARFGTAFNVSPLPMILAWLQEVREPGSPSPPPSPPPLTELFPEQRIAVYQMSLRQLDPDV